MAYTTYENRNNRHTTIHKDGCSQIRKNGGFGEGEYHTHKTLKDAETYAKTTNLPMIKCSYCSP